MGIPCWSQSRDVCWKCYGVSFSEFFFNSERSSGDYRTWTLRQIHLEESWLQYNIRNFNGETSLLISWPILLSFFVTKSCFLYWNTTQACPHVAGVAALLWTHFPECTNNQIRNALIRSANEPPTTDPRNTPGWDKYYGW